MEISLRERGGAIPVSLEAWRRLRLEDSVGMLAHSGILRIERTSAAVLLIPSHYVGEMRAPGVRLTVKPKDVPLYQAITSLALKFAGKDARDHEEGPRRAQGDNLATEFVDSLTDCLEEGVPWQYERAVEATSRPRGKPLLAKTISAFVSRGIMHKLIASHHERRQMTSLASVVWTAYLHLHNASGASQKLAHRAALLIEVFEAPTELAVSDAISLGQGLLVGSDILSRSARALVEVSLAILNQEKAIGRTSVPIPSGTAQFLDLEKVWERAVGTLLAETAVAMSTSIVLHGLAKAKMRLYGDSGPVINPDIIALSSGGTIKIVADAKYKIMSDAERDGIAADVYQLTCYVERIGSPLGLLVYVGETESVSPLGRTKSGCEMLSIRVSAQRLIVDGSHALSSMLGTSFGLSQSC